MKEFYLTQEIPLDWPEKIREEIVLDMKKKLPSNSNIRYLGYAKHEPYTTTDENIFVIIYTTGKE
jgi:hypothetical protein